MGYFGIGIYHPKHEANVGGLWRSAHIFGASFLFTIGQRYKRKQASDTTDARHSVPMYCYDDFADFHKHIPFSCPLICIEECDGYATLLPQFVHPRNCVYLLGAEDHGLPSKVLVDAVDVIRIPTYQPWPLNVSSAGSIVLYDRWMKLQQRSRT